MKATQSHSIFLMRKLRPGEVDYCTSDPQLDTGLLPPPHCCDTCHRLEHAGYFDVSLVLQV